MGQRKVSKASKVFGDYYWASGPIVLGSAGLARAAAARDAALLAALGEAKEAPEARRLLGEMALLFGPTNAPMCWRPSEIGGVLVRARGHVPRTQRDTVLGLGPEHVPAGGFRLAALTVELTGEAERCFVDPWAGQPAKKIPAAIPVRLPAGLWEIDHAVVGEPPISAELFRFRPAGTPPPGPTATAAAPRPPTVTLQRETQAAAKALRFVETEGGPVLVLPVAALPQWRGICDDGGKPVFGEQPTDYDRACDARGPILSFAGVEALVLDQESTAFYRASDTVSYLLRWIGADDGAHVLQAVLSADRRAWRSSRKVFTLASEGGVAIIDSAAYGPGLREPAHGDLAPGRYRIDTMTEFNGELLDGEGRHGLMASALRLRRI
ncbi:MAG TPA: Imm21 family immunity protein [Pseudomonadota bacterium]|nr:Imm21 family immunity protein [Pseudomonadota bacterium]